MRLTQTQKRKWEALGITEYSRAWLLKLVVWFVSAEVRSV